VSSAAPIVFVATCDLSAHLRGRSAPISRVGRVLADGLGWVPANLAITAAGPLAEGEAFGSRGDLRLSPDASTLCPVPADGTHPAVDLYLADQTEIDGRPWPCCPRTFLRDAIADLAAAGLHVRAAFEHEFMICDAEVSPPFSWHRARSAEPFGTDLVTLLEQVGLQPETWLPEYGRGQFEITLVPAAALVAADRAVLLRELVRDLARRRGARVTFAPLPDPDDVGNGVHVHFSLTDDDGRPALFDPSRPGRLSARGAAFAAGILRHAPALTALTAASPVSFLRLVPHRWSAGGIYLAERDREALLRICPTPGQGDPDDDGAAFNLEFRAADATANPWLVLGALIRAGLQGLQADYPPAPVSTDADNGPALAAAPLPTSLDAALDALEADEVVSGWLDPRLRHTYLAVKRSDLAAMAGLSEREQCGRVADAY
jgi:glutamine synthetase